jgi:phosphoglycolate phosphatase-like HAD superfamily hydrolase
MIRNIIWDADGTLFDTYPAIIEAFCRAFGDLGGEVDAERVEPLAKTSFSHCAATLGEELVLAPEAVLERFHEIAPTLPVEEQKPFPQVVELCEYVLDSGGQNFIVTHRHRASLNRLLEAHDIADYFTEAITAADDFPRKPDPAAFEYLVKKYDLIPEVTLAVGDRELDVRAAKRAGLRTCFFGTNPHETEVEFEVTHFDELLTIVQGENEVTGTE